MLTTAPTTGSASSRMESSMSMERTTSSTRPPASTSGSSRRRGPYTHSATFAVLMFAATKFDKEVSRKVLTVCWSLGLFYGYAPGRQQTGLEKALCVTGHYDTVVGWAGWSITASVSITTPFFIFPRRKTCPPPYCVAFLHGYILEVCRCRFRTRQWAECPDCYVRMAANEEGFTATLRRDTGG
jgi:hypothetical protein